MLSLLYKKSHMSLGLCFYFCYLPHQYFPILLYQHCCCYCCSVTSVMSNSVRLHRWQPTRLPFLWDSPGKNTEAGCHFLLQCMKVKSESEATQSCPTLSDLLDCSLLGSSNGIFQARVLEWVAIAFSMYQHQMVLIILILNIKINFQQ